MGTSACLHYFKKLGVLEPEPIAGGSGVSGLSHKSMCIYIPGSAWEITQVGKFYLLEEDLEFVSS